MDTSTQDERLMAGFAHVAILFRAVGIVVPIVMWATQREKSKFVQAHALQALGWQALDVVLSLLLIAVCMALFVSLSFAPAPGSPSNAPAPGMLMAFGGFGLVGLVMLVMIIFGVVAACHAFQGKPYVYPIIGRYMQRFQR